MTRELFIESLRMSYIDFARKVVNNRKIGKSNVKEFNLLFLLTAYLEILELYFSIEDESFYGNFYDEDEINEIIDHYNRIINSNFTFRHIPKNNTYEEDYLVFISYDNEAYVNYENNVYFENII